jgi:hypothetical protein
VKYLRHLRIKPLYMVSELKLTKCPDIRATEGDLMVGEVNVLLLIFEKFACIAEIKYLTCCER